MGKNMVERLKEIYQSEIQAEYRRIQNMLWDMRQEFREGVSKAIEELCKDTIEKAIRNALKNAFTKKFAEAVKIKVNRYSGYVEIELHFHDALEAFEKYAVLEKLERDLTNAFHRAEKQLYEWEKEALLRRVMKLEIDPPKVDMELFEDIRRQIEEVKKL